MVVKYVVVPNALSDAIYKKIDAALANQPKLKRQRENIYKDLLAYYDEHGVVPDFTVEPTNPEVTNE